MAFNGFNRATPSRGWVAPEGVAAWRRAGDVWAQMEKQVESAAAEATELHILGPMRKAAADPEVADAIQSFAHNGEAMVGVPPNHPAANQSVALEYGTEETAPQPFFRSVIWDGMDNARDAFYRGMQ